MPIRSLIVDDEIAAREIIKNYLSDDDNFEVIGESSNGIDAIRQIVEKKPDLVFLDIQMPEMDGFEVIETIGMEDLPHIVFVTAFDQYAIKAFEINAIDYLLKPFDRNRFLSAVNRTKEHLLSKKTIENQLSNLLSNIKRESHYLSKIMVKTGGRVYFLKADNIKWIEAASNYIKIFSGKESYLVKDTLSNFEKNINPNQFVRIHRSCIININFIQEIQPWDKNNHLVILEDGKELKLSRNYKDKIFDLFGSRSG
ncbi:MAG: response regulator transcription factor [bacterium]|nr:response regulator transcription factor [bacterium]